MKVRLILFLISICINNVVEAQEVSICKFERTSLSSKEYKEKLSYYLTCLVDNKIKENDKSELINELSNHGISGKWINSPKIFTSKYICYQAILKLCTRRELEKLMESENPVLRYYGFLGIAEKYQTNVFEELKKLLEDEEIVRGKIGCVVKEKKLADWCIEEVIKIYIYNGEDYKSEVYQLKSIEKQKLDDIIIGLNIELDYKEKLLNEK